MNQETKEDFVTGAVLGALLGACFLVVYFATHDIPEPKVEVIEQNIPDEQRLHKQDRIEFEIRKERERRKVEADIRSMYVPSYLKGC